MNLKLYLIEYDDRSLKLLKRDCEDAGWKVKRFESVSEFTASRRLQAVPLLIFSVPIGRTDEEFENDTAELQNWLDENSGTQLLLLLKGDFGAGDRLALKLRARNVLHKPYRTEDLYRTLSMVAQGVGHRNRIRALNERHQQPVGFEQIISVSESMSSVIELAQTVTRSDYTSIMITGENGTGKGALAEAIHHASSRSSSPFVEVNCAAIPRNLLESEFFGYEQGAFTDAKEEKIGLFECANGGTIFLDEVGEIDYSLQAKLLKFLDTRTIRRISGTRFLPVDVRVISATNRDLKKDIEERRFRADLFYRLNVVEIHIPPLRERPEDIHPIAMAYVKKFTARLKKGQITLTDEAVKTLERYSWPGNIRELINLIERTVLLNKNGKIEPVDFPLTMEEQGKIALFEEEQGRIKVKLPSEGLSLEECERAVIAATLEKVGGNITKAARQLKVGRGTLRYKLKKYEIEPSDFKKKLQIGSCEPLSLTD